jgi:hypothetical protein
MNKLDFGDIALGKSDEKILKISNNNPVPITFEDIVKDEIDEINIDLVEVIDRLGRKVEPVWNKESLIPH